MLLFFILCCFSFLFSCNLTFLDFFANLQVYHPNIDLEGNVCLNILREDWKPVLNINTIIYGLYHLFTVISAVFSRFLWFHSLMICDFCGTFFTSFICRNRIMRIRWIMMLLLCWEITLRCLNLMWEELWLVGMWGKPFSQGASSSCLGNIK